MVGQGFEREEGQVHGWVDVRLDMRYLYEKECKGGDGLMEVLDRWLKRLVSNGLGFQGLGSLSYGL